MAYTVKTLAKLSGVSVRTLHFYDEICLLKPAYCGDNGYRYYEEEQLLMLQQILFFRELGFPLSDIQKILGSEDFDRVKALESHKHVLQEKAEQTAQLIRTIDKTIARLKGEHTMKDKEIYEGFDPKKQKEYENYWIKQGKEAEALVNESRKRTKNWKKEDYERIKKETDELHKELAAAVQKNLTPESSDVQTLIRRHYQMIENFYTPTKEIYVGLGKMYNEHPDFKKTYDSYHPKLAEFMAYAMNVFAQAHL